MTTNTKYMSKMSRDVIFPEEQKPRGNANDIAQGLGWGAGYRGGIGGGKYIIHTLLKGEEAVAKFLNAGCQPPHLTPCPHPPPGGGV